MKRYTFDDFLSRYPRVRGIALNMPNIPGDDILFSRDCVNEYFNEYFTAGRLSLFLYQLQHYLNVQKEKDLFS